MEEFWEQEVARIRLENAALEQNTHRRKVGLMEKLANTMPGATVNDFEELLKNPFWSLRFLRDGLWKLILGRR